MTHNSDQGDSKEQRQQAAKNSAPSVAKAARPSSYDKKLDGPNRPSI